MSKIKNAFWSGMMATGPMTLALLEMQSALKIPRDKALPPAALTNDILPAQELISKGRRIDSTLLSHFGFSVAAALVYSMFDKNIKTSTKTKGAAYGLAVWATSYLGWVPAFGLRPSAKNVSDRRNAQMISAHIVWGISLATFMDAFERHGHREWDGETPAE